MSKLLARYYHLLNAFIAVATVNQLHTQNFQFLSELSLLLETKFFLLLSLIIIQFSFLRNYIFIVVRN